MLKLLSPIGYCQGIRRERGTLLLVLFFVKHEIYADVDVPLKPRRTPNSRCYSRAAGVRQTTPDRASYSYYTGFLDLVLARTLPSSACREVLQFPWLLCLLVGKLVTSFSVAPISILIVPFGLSVTLWPEHLSLGSPSVYLCPFAVSKA